jgi:hypothetical protein
VSIRITEKDVPSPREVVLDGDDMPYGEERGSAAFESGGKLVRERIDLPGRDAPIFHVHASPERPMVLKGAFRDWLTSTGHARVMRDALLALWRRANLLRLVWGDQERDVLLDEPKFGEESEHSITYELTFEVATAPDSLSFEAAPPETAASTLVDVLKERLAARRAAMARVGLERTLLQSILAGVDAVLGGLDTLQREVSGLDRTVGDLGARVRRVTGIADRVRQLADAPQRLLRQLALQRALTVARAEDIAAGWKAQFDCVLTLDDVLDGMRTVRAEARRRERAADRLYRVKPGDTLESIAGALLGGAARAGELGLRADELTPGRLVRLPGSP